MTKEEKETLKVLQEKAKHEIVEKKKRGLTDKIFIAVATCTVAAFVYAAMLMWVTKDTSGLAYFIPSISGFGTIVLTAIVAKNTAEKKYKFRNQDNREDGIEC